MIWNWPLRESRSALRPSASASIQTSQGTPRTKPVKAGGVTPATANALEFRTIVFPTMAGLPPNRRIQRP